jgi:hypothetical protein
MNRWLGVGVALSIIGIGGLTVLAAQDACAASLSRGSPPALSEGLTPIVPLTGPGRSGGPAASPARPAPPVGDQTGGGREIKACASPPLALQPANDAQAQGRWTASSPPPGQARLSSEPGS